MKTIEWKIAIDEDTNKIMTVEHASGLPQDKLESHLTIIGILENIKQKHLIKLKTLFSKTAKDDDTGLDL